MDRVPPPRAAGAEANQMSFVDEVIMVRVEDDPEGERLSPSKYQSPQRGTEAVSSILRTAASPSSRFAKLRRPYALTWEKRRDTSSGRTG